MRNELTKQMLRKTKDLDDNNQLLILLELSTATIKRICSEPLIYSFWNK